MIHAMESAVRPPVTWIVPDPAQSRNPSPMPRWAICESQPPPQTQCAKTGYVIPANRAVEAQIAPRRQRSEPLPRGMMAANPTDSICRQAMSEALSL